MMDYQEIIDWMFHQLPMYQTQGASAYKKDLNNTLLLAEYLGNPEKKLKCIHVAGTNGKGSTSHLLASIFQEAGFKVGLYTSPHLKDFRERIKINGEEISKEFIITFFNKHKVFFEKNQLSFFEMSVGLAFDYFKNNKTDINIIEVGLGGRLDSTNIISPLLSIITNIGFDHIQFLGNTIDKIATEKAGIIKNNIPVVIGEYNIETKHIFFKKAKNTNSDIYFASELIKENYPSVLLGDYQTKNKKTVIQAIQVLNQKYNYSIDEKIIKIGFLNVIKNTGLKGRWQVINTNPYTVCDTAHNLDGFKMILNQIQNSKFNKLHMVLGFVNDKKIDDILSILPKDALCYFCKPNNFRGLDEKVLQEKAKEFDLLGEAFDSVTKAYDAAKKSAGKDDFIYVGGSNFVVAEII